MRGQACQICASGGHLPRVGAPSLAAETPPKLCRISGCIFRFLSGGRSGLVLWPELSGSARRLQPAGRWFQPGPVRPGAGTESPHCLPAGGPSAPPLPASGRIDRARRSKIRDRSGNRRSAGKCRASAPGPRLQTLAPPPGCSAVAPAGLRCRCHESRSATRGRVRRQRARAHPNATPGSPVRAGARIAAAASWRRVLRVPKLLPSELPKLRRNLAEFQAAFSDFRAGAQGAPRDARVAAANPVT